MGAKLLEILSLFEKIAPSSLSESWDNSGLQIGNSKSEINKVLLCLDVTSEIVDEAINIGANLIISHHPFIFNKLTSISDLDIKGSLILKLIHHDISVISEHTNLDLASKGLNKYLAKRLGLNQIKNLKAYKEERLYKLVVFVPLADIDKVHDAMCKNGAGWVGKYKDCSFMSSGIGTFRPLEGTNPHIGKVGELERVEEVRLETIVPHKKIDIVIAEMKKAHPYEEVAYDVYELGLRGIEYGYGKYGLLNKEVNGVEFIEDLKILLNLKNVRVIGKLNKMIKKVAVFSGSFDPILVNEIIKRDIDVMITGDVKYHTALDATENGLLLVDAGHFGTESIVVDLLSDILTSKFPNLEIYKSKLLKDPFEIY